MKLKPFPIAIFALAIFILAWLHVSHGLFTRYNYLTARWDKRQGNVRLLIYGERVMNDKQQFDVARQMGFGMQTIAGCIISKSEANAADAYNAVMTTALDKKLGKQWKVGFDNSVDSLYQLQSDNVVYKALVSKMEIRQQIAHFDSLAGKGKTKLDIDKLRNGIRNAYITVQTKNGEIESKDLFRLP